MTDRSNVTLNASDPFSYDESFMFSSLHDTASLGDLRGVHHLNCASANHNLDETFPFDVNNQTGEAHVPSLDVTVPCSSTLTEESGQTNYNPSGSQFSRVTRYGRDVHMPVRFNDYDVEGKHKYGVERSVNYSALNNEFFLCLILIKRLNPKLIMRLF